jgi:hypothetical protein
MREGTLLLRSSHVLSRSFADETLVAAPDGGEVDRFTASAAAVWDLLEEPRSFDDLIAIVGATYGAPAEIVAGDLEPFVRELIDRGWVLEVRDVDD